jgi:spoIIIJ-associated protein
VPCPRLTKLEETDVTDAQSPADADTVDVTEGADLVTDAEANGHSSAPVETAPEETAEADPTSGMVAEDVAGEAEDDDADDDAEGDDSDQGDGSEDGDGSAGTDSKRRGTTLRRLEEEGEVAADYLEELLDIADIDGDIDIDVENGRASVGIVAESSADRSLRRLVGQNGEVLEALQELSRLAVQAATGERSRLMLDVAGFRASRRRTLEGVAARACQEVQRTGEAQHLEPMSAFERKVVHDVVADAGLVSESEGEDPRRHVVIKPA